MRDNDKYQPSPTPAVRQQVADYEASAGQRGAAGPESGLPVVILTTRGARSGHLRKTPLMRIERDGSYLLVASNDGKPVDPAWYHNLTAQPVAVLQDGPVRHIIAVREVGTDEYEQSWAFASCIYPPYDDYRATVSRHIPILLAEPTSPTNDFS
jgi:deazaflavin-dependent oxidoreductase (nitroreductase family)